MEDVKDMPDGLLQIEADAFYQFIHVFGHEYITEAGRIRFNSVTGEQARRRVQNDLDALEAQQQKRVWDGR